MNQNYEAFTSIYNELQPKIFKLCKGYFNGDEALANDVMQEIFIKVWQNHERFRQESSVGTWVYRIAVNTCLMHIRKSKGTKEWAAENLPDRPDETYDATTDQRLKKMYACIAELDETSRLIILMVLEGMDYVEIAAIVGISEDTLRVKIHRIKKSLTLCVHGKI
jgi:RNA polymerase sigma factor (sigma-70 family)